MNELERDYLKAAADMVMAQAEEAEGEYGIPVDPEIADYLGAFEEDPFSDEAIYG
jgi:hypothetical protein